MEQPTAVVLAGGLGTRIQHVLAGRPKPLAPVAGKPFLEWLLRYLKAQQIRRVIISAGYRAEMIEVFASSVALPELNTTVIAEHTPQGTAGGFLEAIADAQSATWIVTNGDSLVCADLRGFISELGDETVDAALVGLHVDDASRYGTLRCDSESNLLAFAEKTPGAGLINAGIYLFRHRAVASFPRQRPLAFETDVFPALLGGGAKIRVHKVTAPFIDIGTEASLREAEDFIVTNQRFFS